MTKNNYPQHLFLPVILLSFIPHILSAQSDTLKEITINAYRTTLPVFKATTSVSVIDSTLLHSGESQPAPAVLNTQPGVRFEERSPGSFRLSVRGSLLRSPFGIRNIRMYINGFPLSDAGGNTYLNLLDIHAFNRIEILKGPDGTYFGANTGGVVFLESGSFTKQQSVNIYGGSYKLKGIRGLVSLAGKKHGGKLYAQLEESSGYRDHSGLSKKFVLTDHEIKHRSSVFRLTAFYADLRYETPGGLTRQQAEANPQAARPATNFFPGAEIQNAGVMNRTLFTGISHTGNISSGLRNTILLSGMYTDFRNPFITNYEMRQERTASIRDQLELSSDTSGEVKWAINAGLEYQVTGADVRNFGNREGTRDTMQSSDAISVGQAVAFAGISVSFSKKIYLDAAMSMNIHEFNYEGRYPVPSPPKKKYSSELMPRAGLSWKIRPLLAWRISASRGISPPTISEFRASDQVINAELRAEHGWNFETGIRWSSTYGKFIADLAAYRFGLNDAIVRRVSIDDEEYFINAGSTRQNGAELSVAAILYTSEGGFIKNVLLRSGFAYSDYRFTGYQIDETDYSGNVMTGVPRFTSSDRLEIQFASGFRCSINYYYTGKIFLDDGNDVSSAPSHVAGLWLSKRIDAEKFFIEVYASCGNVFNEFYSSGYDLNAPGGRFYNPSPTRHFSGGLRLSRR